MINLLCANVSRLFKSKIFWLCMASLFVMAIFSVIKGGRVDAIEDLGRDLEYYYFHTLPYFGLFLSVFVSLFLGTEYSDGTIRNKLVVGHTRGNIFVANFLTSLIGAVGLFIAWAIGGLAGIPYFGLWSVGIGGYFQLLAVSLFTVIATTAIMVLISQLITNKAINAVTAVFAAIVLLILASYFYNALCEPETIMSEVRITAEEGVEFGDEKINPAYVKGVMRPVYETILNLLPTGQQIWIADETVDYPVIMILASLVVTFFTSGIGYLFFRKKDLK